MSVTGAEACVWASISTERVTRNHDERVLHRRQTQKFDPSPYFHKWVKDWIDAIRPQRAVRSPENPNATLDTLASPADDVRHP